MDGKTFMRIFLFAESYGHGWASALHPTTSTLDDEGLDPQDTALNDAVKRVIPFNRAVDAWHHAKDDKELDNAEAMLISLVDTEAQQRALLKDSCTIQIALEEAAEEDSYEYEYRFGILSSEVFSEEEAGPLKYKHSTGSGRLSIDVHGDVAVFSVSRPNEPNLLCLGVDGEAYSLYSGEPDSPLDEEVCWSRWDKYLRLRHALALKDAVRAFFALKEDRELLRRILAAVDETAIEIFSTQEESIEFYCHFLDWRGRTPTMFLSETELSEETRSALYDALAHPAKDGAPALIPFDCTPSAPYAEAWRDIFGFSTEPLSPRGLRGTVVVPAWAHDWYGEWKYLSFFFGCGIDACEIRHFAELRKKNDPSASVRDCYKLGLCDVINTHAHNGTGVPNFFRRVYYHIHSPERAIAELGAEPGDEDAPAPDEEPAQEESEGKDYTLEEIREMVRENYAAMGAPHTDDDGQEEAVEEDREEVPEEETSEEETPQKYEILREPQYAHPNTRSFPGTYRIRALRDIPRWDIKAGDLGGFVGGEFTLSHDGDAWIADSAVASADSRVYGNAILAEHAIVTEGSHIFENASIRDESHVFDQSKVHGETILHDRAIVLKSDIAGNIRLRERARIDGVYLLSRGEIELEGHSALSGGNGGHI